MVKIIGILVVLGSVFGGFLLSGGKLAALIHPFEVMIIGGAALGGFLQANPGSTTKIVFQKSLKMFGNRFTHAFYLEVLGLLYAVLNKSRREGMMAIEADLEDPAASAVFSKYPGVLKDERMTAFICDYLRIMSSGSMAPHELEGLFDGILASYGFFGPLSGALEHDAKEELNLYEAIKATLVASASGMPPSLAAEFGRKVLFQAHRPSFSELEQAMRGS